jgi:hypothetical protein
VPATLARADVGHVDLRVTVTPAEYGDGGVRERARSKYSRSFGLSVKENTDAPTRLIVASPSHAGVNPRTST